MYSSVILDFGIFPHYDVSGQVHVAVALVPLKQPPLHFGQETGCGQEPVWTTCSTEKTLAPTGNRKAAVPLLN